ncbi:MAG TPA: hypothetical protein G4N94_02765 [Caldilineae bacterium]|nr:hypothetical protein [Caldilineae bacterium]
MTSPLNSQQRAFQAAIEGCTDIASHIVSVYSLGQPQAQRDLFQFLDEAGYYIVN